MSIGKAFVDEIFPSRLHRLDYFLRSLAIDIVASFLYSTSTTMVPVWWWTLVLVVFVYTIFFIFLPRVRDAGMSAWWIPLGVVIPIVGIVLGVLLLFRAPSYHLHHSSESKEPAMNS